MWKIFCDVDLFFLVFPIVTNLARIPSHFGHRFTRPSHTRCPSHTHGEPLVVEMGATPSETGIWGLPHGSGRTMELSTGSRSEELHLRGSASSQDGQWEGRGLGALHSALGRLTHGRHISGDRPACVQIPRWFRYSFAGHPNFSIS